MHNSFFLTLLDYERTHVISPFFHATDNVEMDLM